MLTAREVVDGLSGELTAAWGYNPDDVYRRVIIDSRMADVGDMFVALPGERHDGHDFLRDAVANGAAAVLVSRRPDGLNPGVAIFQVRDTLAGLQRLAGQRLARSGALVVGITGSVGKTTCKELVAAVLSSRYKVFKSPANFNSEIGLPLALLDMEQDCQRAVLEMAMFQPGEIRGLCQITSPTIGVVTNVGPSHMERLGSIEAIAQAKAELPESLPPDGFAVLNGDDPLVAEMASRTRAGVILYGRSAECTLRGEDEVSHGLDGIAFGMRFGRNRQAVRLSLPGLHNLHNALAAAAVGIADGLSLREAAEALSASQAPSRVRVVPGLNGSTILDDSYNASPPSMLAALALLHEMPGRALALLGDMRELGSDSEAGHREVGRRVAQVADVIYCLGEGGQIIARAAQEAGHPAVHICHDKQEAAQALAKELRAGDYLLVKASRALALETVVEDLKGSG